MTTRLFSFALCGLVVLLALALASASAATNDQLRFALPEPAAIGRTALPAGEYAGRFADSGSTMATLVLEPSCGRRLFVPAPASGGGGNGSASVTLE